jgi:hypothetical protein
MKAINVFLVSMTLIFAFSRTLSAQQQAEPKPLRFDVTAFLGYRTSMSFPVEPAVTGMNPRAVLDASPSYGASFGMRLRAEEDLIEIR